MGMTNDEAMKFGDMWRQINGACKDSKSNHIEDFRYKMEQECNNQSYCLYCPYHYIYSKYNQLFYDGCFKDDLEHYISYQESKHS